MCCRYLSPLGLLFLVIFLMVLSQAQVLNYNIVKVINLCFFIHNAFHVFSKKSFPTLTSWRYSPILTFIISIVLPYTLRSLIYFKIIFKWSVRIEIQFHFSSYKYSIAPHHLLKKSLFPIYSQCWLCQISSVNLFMGISVSFLFCSIYLFV